jgi:hypothetical protein
MLADQLLITDFLENLLSIKINRLYCSGRVTLRALQYINNSRLSDSLKEKQNQINIMLAFQSQIRSFDLYLCLKRTNELYDFSGCNEKEPSTPREWVGPVYEFSLIITKLLIRRN